MLSGPGQFAENETNEVNFREIPSHVLQKVCMYITYKVRYTTAPQRSLNFPSSQKSLSNCLWQQISWIARRSQKNFKWKITYQSYHLLRRMTNLGPLRVI